MRPTPSKAAAGMTIGVALLTATAFGQNTATPGSTEHATNSPTPPKIACVIRVFMRKAADDPALRSLLEKHRITLQYSVTDLGMNCFVGHGPQEQPHSTSQPSALRAEVVLVSDAQTLDQLLRGTTGELEYGMELRLNLVRRLKLAADLKAIRAALSRVYTEALGASATPELAGSATQQ